MLPYSFLSYDACYASCASKAKQKKKTEAERPKLCYHAKLHGKLPFCDGKAQGLEPRMAQAEALLSKAGESTPKILHTKLRLFVSRRKPSKAKEQLRRQDPHEVIA